MKTSKNIEGNDNGPYATPATRDASQRSATILRAALKMLAGGLVASARDFQSTFVRARARNVDTCIDVHLSCQAARTLSQVGHLALITDLARLFFKVSPHSAALFAPLSRRLVLVSPALVCHSHHCRQ